MQEYFYPYFHDTTGWDIGPLFDEKIRAAAWMIDRLARHLVVRHDAKEHASRWVEEIAEETVRYLRYELTRVSCPLCDAWGSIDFFRLDQRLKRKKFAVVGEGIQEPDRIVHTNLSFPTAMRRLIQVFEEHLEKHNITMEEIRADDDLSTRYCCPRCDFEAEIVPHEVEFGGVHPQNRKEGGS